MLKADLSQELCSASLGLPKESEVIFADVARSGTDSYLAVVLTCNADGSTNACRWHVYSATDGNSYSMSKPKWDPLQHPGKCGEGGKAGSGAALLTCALHRPQANSTAQPTLSVVWDSLVWQRFRVGTRNPPTLEASSHVSGVVPAQRRASAARGKVAAPASGGGVVAATIDSDYLLVIGREGVVGDKGNASFNSLTAWDSIYGTRQGAAHLRWSADDADVAHYSTDTATAARASHDGSLVAVALDKCVVVCSLDSAAMSMDMVVTAAANARNQAPTRTSTTSLSSAAMRPVDVLACIAMAVDAVDNEHSASGGVVASEAPRTRLAQAVQEGNRREAAVLSQITSEAKSSKWVEAVKLYLEDLQAESVNAEAARRASKTNASSSSRRRPTGSSRGGAGAAGSARAAVRVAVSEELVDAVIARCTEAGAEAKYNEALVSLLDAGAVSLHAHSSLLPYVIESGNLVVLESILKHAPDLLEEDLLACLKLILLNIRKHSMDTFITTWAAASPETPVLDHDAVRRHLVEILRSQLPLKLSS